MDCVAAGTNATVGWLLYVDLYGMDEYNLLLQHDVFSDLELRDMPLGHTIKRIPKVDPTSRALPAAGHRLRHARNLACVVRMAPWRHLWWTPCMKCGRFPNGASLEYVLTNGMYRFVLAPLHASMQRIIWRRQREPLLHCDARHSVNPCSSCAPPARVGAPASINADAPRGLSRIGYQSSFSAPELRGGRKDILFRMKGTSPSGSGAPRDTPPQRGILGIWVCCARITHVAAPTIYPPGAGDWL